MIDPGLALVVSEAMARTGLGQSDVLRLGALRGVPEITMALTAGEHGPRLPEAELRKRIDRVSQLKHSIPENTGEIALS